jgi:DNA repair exonuclease SbcCD nuclease subunit
MIRFLHTSDWQLGMTRHFLAGEAQSRFTQDRIDAIRAIGRVVAERDAQFVVVAGDVFEHNQVSRQTVQRACDALQAVPVPVILLPGNHDPLSAGSVYRGRAFTDGKPDNVIVLEDPAPIAVPGVSGVEVLGAPWRGKSPAEDLVARALRTAPSAVAGTHRIVVGHGIVDALSPDRDRVDVIALDALETAITADQIAYVALGDRHSATSVGSTGAIWYSGSPEPTDYDEVNAGKVLCVTIDGGTPEIEEIGIGHWRFVDLDEELDGDEALDAFAAKLQSFDDKERTILRLALRGSLTVAESARLEDLLERMRDAFAALQRWERHDKLVVRAEGDGPEQLGLRGYAADAWERLAAEAENGDTVAADALMLLHRLAREVQR